MVAGVLPAPRLVKELDFKVIKEQWLTIKLKDGSIVKLKPVLLKVFETDAKDPMTGESVYMYEGHNVVSVRSPENLRGNPSEHMPSPTEALKMPKETRKEIDFEVIDPSWNSYELENGKIIKTKAVVTNVYKIAGVFDRYGNPYYVVRSQMVVGSSQPQLLQPELSAPEMPDAYFAPVQARWIPCELPIIPTSSMPISLIQERAHPDWTKPPIKLQDNKLVIDPREMNVGTTYQVEYQGRVHLFVKRGENIIDVYEVIKE